MRRWSGRRPDSGDGVQGASRQRGLTQEEEEEEATPPPVQFSAAHLSRRKRVRREGRKEEGQGTFLSSTPPACQSN